MKQCWRKRAQQLKKRKKSCFLDFEKKNFQNPKNIKTRKKRTHSFRDQLITQPLVTQLQEVTTGKSRSPASNILLRSAATRNYATENCV